MSNGELIALTVGVAVIALGAFVYASSQKASEAALKSTDTAASSVGNINALAGTINKGLMQLTGAGDGSGA